MTARAAWAVGIAVIATSVAAAAVMVERSPLPPSTWLAHPVASFALAEGDNPFPVRLLRPASAPLSAMAQLGRLVFFDQSLSSSGRLSCAGCHQPDHAYGPPGDAPAMAGGPTLARQGARAVPSLMYLERQPNFSIGPDNDENEGVDLLQLAALGQQTPRARKSAQDSAPATASLVPQGGLFWDGRADTLQDQAVFPLLNPLEMDGGTIERVAAKLRQAPYAPRFVELFGIAVLDSPPLLVSEALFAVARYQIEEPSFHPYTSKFDFWLEGKARLSPAELRGYVLFNDPAKGNCGGCHLDRPSPDGLAPMFTDYQYEALGVPRNPALAANHDPAYYDLGICGPYRSDMRSEAKYCGMFLTPTLRNTAARQVFFHNGVYHSLKQVLDFYDFRDTEPEKIYPRGADGSVEKFDDVPPEDRANIDVSDPPFDRKQGEKPPLSAAEEDDIIAFLKTLTDGYQPEAHAH